MDCEAWHFPKNSEFNFLQFLIENFVYFRAGMVLIGMLYFIGGLTLRKYKLWANQLTTYLSILLLALIWIVTIAISRITTESPEMEVYRIMPFFSGLFWTVPFGLLIWFLNRQDIKKHFA
jgi:hypothetical protein